MHLFFKTIGLSLFHKYCLWLHCRTAAELQHGLCLSNKRQISSCYRRKQRWAGRGIFVVQIVCSCHASQLLNTVSHREHTGILSSKNLNLNTEKHWPWNIPGVSSRNEAAQPLWTTSSNIWLHRRNVCLASTFLETVSSILLFCSIWKKKKQTPLSFDCFKPVHYFPCCHLLEALDDSSLLSLHSPPLSVIQPPSLSHPGMVHFVFVKLKSPSVGSHVLNRNHYQCFIILFLHSYSFWCGTPELHAVLKMWPYHRPP